MSDREYAWRDKLVADNAQLQYALEQSEGHLEEALSNWRRSAMEAALAQGEIIRLRDALIMNKGE